jgi:hypothetical protein
MGLSRLSQLLSNVTGRTLYVNSDSVDATDSIENRGNSPTRPFYSLNRAIAEAVRFSYQGGFNNDRTARCTISLAPGIYNVTNRPGWLPDGANNFRLRNGTTSSDFPQWDSNTNFDITTANNALYKLNSVHGGIFLPRGVSIIGQDYNKTIIVPDYVPNPENDSIERSAIFLLTGRNYLEGFAIDDPTNYVYKDYTTNKYAPLFSQHKLTDYENADGVNGVVINDIFQSYSTARTDLQIYYEKIGLAFGPASGREIQPDYPSTLIDLQPRSDEYKIVGAKGKEIDIVSIRAGNGVTPTTLITVTLAESVAELDVDTPIKIQGISAAGYDGQYIVRQVNSSTEFTYRVSTAPASAAPSTSGATFSISVDTVSASSPYLNNLASKTAWGRSSLHVDGSKTLGFKSVLVSRFTGIGLQKDPKAFVKYNSTFGVFEDNTASGNENIQTNSKSRYKPSYENYHIKSSNDGYVQIVSAFAIGYANQFLSESGSDQSLNASASNFGSKALVARGFKDKSFIRDDVGYITHIIPPKEIEVSENTISYEPIDVTLTKNVGLSSHLYLYNRKSASNPPEIKINGYNVGSKKNELLKVVINSTEYYALTTLQNGTTSGEKLFTVGQSSSGISSISFNTLTLTQNHNLLSGESVRITSETGQLPDGLNFGQLYYTITTGQPNQIKLAQTLSDSVSGNELAFNNKGGKLSVSSKVSDKVAGEIGHPIQYDSNGWYITVESGNQIYNALTVTTAKITPRTYITRKNDNRSDEDTIYKVRYVIPSSVINARAPIEGYVVQESNSTIGESNAEVSAAFNITPTSLSDSNKLRNQKLISFASWSSGIATFSTELPHNLSEGSYIEVKNIKSTNNTIGADNSGYNGIFLVTKVNNLKQFNVSVTVDPGTFTNNTSVRTTTLPYLRRKKYKNVLQINKVEEIRQHKPGLQDGIYYLTLINSSNSPISEPFTGLSYSQPVEYLFPARNKDNPVADPKSTSSFAVSEPLGQVIVSDPSYSITKETLDKIFLDQTIGIGISNIISNTAGIAHTIYTKTDHGLNPITSLSITSSGSGYGVGSGNTEFYYNAQLINNVSSGENATARVSVNSAGSISSITVMDGGSNYKIGDQLKVVGIATTTGYTSGIVSVVTIYNNIGNTLKINNTIDSYNTSYLITGISSSRSINVSSAASISSPYVNGIGVTNCSKGYIEFTGNVIGISTIAYSSSLGIATITTNQKHGLFVNNKILFGGFSTNFFNSTFVVNSVVGVNTFTIFTGVSSANVSYTGTPYIYRQGASSNGGTIGKNSENLGGRMVTNYAGITTVIDADVNATNQSFSINAPLNLGLKIGDYLLIDEEIVRISTTISGNTITVFRGLLGTLNVSHTSGSYIYKIRPLPIELRRNSIVKASAHTFEYVGYGAGNYSAALPELQDRVLSDKEETIAQSTKESGGEIVFGGLNADGDFYVNSDKINDVQNTVSSNAKIKGSLIIEGGIENKQTSEFSGPVIFNDKIISNSNKGIEANSLYLKGTANTSKNYTVGDSIPILEGNPGDVQYNSNPLSGGFLGWVFTNNNRWEKFGRIANYGGSVDSVVGVSNGGSFIGFATSIDFRTTGIVLSSSFNYDTGITTLTFSGASPFGNAIGFSTGANIFAGLTTQINFTGTSNISISGLSTGSGIGTVVIGISSNSPITASGFIKRNAPPNNFLRAGGTDSTLSSSDITNALGFTPANSASVTGDPASGNSIILDPLAAFDNVTTVFNLFLNGARYTPFGGDANLIVSLGGITQKPGTDFYITKNAGINTSSITFTTAPSAGLSHFIVALGGQSSLLGNPSWDAKGDLAVGITDNNASILGVGANGQVLTADSTQATGLRWADFFQSGTTLLFYQASAPTGWTKITTHNNKALRVVSGTGGGSGGSIEFTSVFTNRGVPLVDHTHSITDPGHSHGIYDPGHQHGYDRSNSNNQRAAGGTAAACNSDLSGSATYPAGTNISIYGAGTGVSIKNASESGYQTGGTMDFSVQYIDVIVCSKN